MMRLVMALLLAAVPLAGCKADDAQPMAVRQIELKGQTLAVEIADNDALRERGLMFRKQMDETKGMLFVWPSAAQRTFWMKNTYLPLDMIFIQHGKVLGVVADAKPLDETPLSVPGASDAVLEVNAGWAARHGVVAGDEIKDVK
jgi:hypothetical protein